MILGSIHHKARCAELDGRLRECLDYAHSHTLSEYEPGSYPIHGDELYVNIAAYRTEEPQNRFWEAHKRYLDLHLILSGAERVDLNLIDNMELLPYVEKDDFLPAEGSPKASVLLEAGDYLVCYPEDVHMTGVCSGESVNVRKAIFKIQV